MTIINLKKINKVVEAFHELEGVQEELTVMEQNLGAMLDGLNDAETKKFCEMTGVSFTQNQSSAGDEMQK